MAETTSTCLGDEGVVWRELSSLRWQRGWLRWHLVRMDRIWADGSFFGVLGFDRHMRRNVRYAVRIT